MVGVETKRDEAVEEGEVYGEGTGEAVVGEGESEEAVEEDKGGREGAREVVVVEEE